MTFKKISSINHLKNVAFQDFLQFWKSQIDQADLCFATVYLFIVDPVDPSVHLVPVFDQMAKDWIRNDCGRPLQKSG